MHLIVASLALLACSLAASQSYPNRPVKMVVPFSAGIGSDVYTRLIAEDFWATLNQSFLVESKGEASAQIGTLDVAKSAPDGFTLLTATIIGHLANPALFKKLAHDPVTDFTAIGHILYMPYLLVVSKTSPLSSLAGLIERARLAPNTLNCAYGNNSGQVALGAEIAPSTPLEMEQFVKQQLSSWGTKIRSPSILPDQVSWSGWGQENRRSPMSVKHQRSAT